MVPPPIRTKFVECAPAQPQPQPSRWCSWFHRTHPREQQELSTPQEDDLVCLSPLSQFFCNVNNPPDIYANMTLEGYCTVEQLVAPMQHMADLHDRFRRRLVYWFGVWKAEVLENFDVRTLMREVTLDGPDAQQAYHDYMGQLMSQEPLGMDGLPPWDVICIHYTCDPHRTDVLMRASHIIGDGQLFMKLIKQIMDPLDSAAEADYRDSILSAPQGTPGVKTRSKAGSSAGGSSSSLCSAGGKSSSSGDSSSCLAGTHHVTAAAGTGQESCCGGGSSSESDSGDCLSSDQLETSSIDSGNAGEELQQHQWQQQRGPALVQVLKRFGQRQQKEQQQQQPKQQAQQLPTQDDHRQPKRQRGGGSFWKLMLSIIQWSWNQYTALIFSGVMLFWFADPVTLVKASEEQCTGPRRWGSVNINLQEFHRVAKTLGHSLNTLAVTCLAGGIRRYLLRYGEVPAERIRLCGMVDTRSMPGLLTGATGNSNNFSFIGVPLFTGEGSPLARLARVGWALSWVRHSLVVPIAIRMPSLIQALFRDPVKSSWAICRALPYKTTVGFSNMKGPQGRWALAGYPVTRIHNGVQPMAFGSFISLFSYCDGLTLTHTCFESKTKSPEVLLQCMLEEYHALRKLACITPDGTVSDPGSPCDGLKIKAA